MEDGRPGEHIEGVFGKPLSDDQGIQRYSICMIMTPLYHHSQCWWKGGREQEGLESPHLENAGVDPLQNKSLYDRTTLI